MSLRRTLVAVQIAVVVVGLAVFGVVSYQLYRHSQYQRAEQSLDTTSRQLSAALCYSSDSSCGYGGAGGGELPGGAPAGNGQGGTGTASTTQVACTGRINEGGPIFGVPGSFAELRSPAGLVLARIAVSFTPSPSEAVAARSCPDPDLPAVLSAGADGSRTFQVPAARGKGPFLVRVSTVGAGPGGPGAGNGFPRGDTLVTAIPLTSFTASLRDLLVLDLSVGAGLVVLLAVVTLVIVRRSLRPLERMATTAQAIAAGDLARRVPPSDERTEVGRLGGALNHMLGNIEGAFAERNATERRLRQFLADASHELRTPLTSIRGYAELWRLSRSGGPPAPGEEPIDAGTAMARIEEHAARMSGMIEELLLLARLDERRPPERRPVDLAVICAEACDDAVAVDRTRRVTLDAPEPVVVTGDAAHLQRAVANLTVNATRHTPAGTPIEVRVTASGGVAAIAVRDHGPGLPPGGLAHAFDRFWQADTSRATGGSGLGLAIVAGVAAEHGGAATVTNPEGGGAEFTIRLPLPRPD